MARRTLLCSLLALCVGCVTSPRNTGVLAVHVGDTLYAASNLRLDPRERSFISASQPVQRDPLSVLPGGSLLRVDTVFDDNDGHFIELHLSGPPRGENLEGRYYLRLERVGEAPARTLLARFLAASVPRPVVRREQAEAVRAGQVRPGMLRAEVRQALGPPPALDGEVQAGEAAVWSFRRLDPAQDPRSLRKDLRLRVRFEAGRVVEVDPADYFDAAEP